jgi:hypothetical protein
LPVFADFGDFGMFLSGRCDNALIRRPRETPGEGVLMSSFRKLRSGLLVVAAAIMIVAGFFGLPAPRAQAFFVQNHELITRNALPPDQVSETAMVQILVGPPPGAGAVGTDAFFSDDFRHLDNANSPADICARAQTAWATFEPVILSGSRIAGNGLADGPAARAAFGGLIHVQQDLYAHSNWVEINIADGQPERLAPPIFPSCDPAVFPVGLHTGYFELAYGNHEDPLAGCPVGGPPPGFVECHSSLNKDGPNTFRGSQPVPGMNMNMYDLAALLATRATTNLYEQIRRIVASSNGQSAAVMLFQAGGGPAGPPINNALPQFG